MEGCHPLASALKVPHTLQAREKGGWTLELGEEAVSSKPGEVSLALGGEESPQTAEGRANRKS